MTRAPEELARTLAYRFQDPQLLQAALTHRSAGSRNNERLEFLGDAVLGYIVAEWLYQRFPQAREGELSRLRATLVKRETLADIARGLELGDYLRMGAGELKSGGFRRDSTLADTLEAVLGAILLDGGIDACRACIERLFSRPLEEISTREELKDAKTRLQEYLQAQRLQLPTYQVLQVSGESHRQQFVVECRVAAAQQATRGQGRSRRRAEQAAAERMLEQLDDRG
ncbi:MAG TPA: ribonuclease III [Gammaproteobacteria bacterium]|nr:ribonuclease III [Gammaproteobacteria bacterium]